MGLAAIAQPSAAPQDHRRLARLLRRVYPGVGGYSSGLKPDAVAELAIAGLVAEDGGIPGGLGTWALIDDDRYENGLRILARAAVTAPSAQAELEKVVGGLGVPRLKIALEVALQVESPYAMASIISSAAMAGRFDDDLDSAFGLLPEETVALSEVAAVLAERLMKRFSPSDERAPRNGFLLVGVSSRFSDAGWNAKALEAVSAGIAELRQDPSEEARPELGRALSNLSNRLWEMGELEASLAPAAEAVELLASEADRTALLGARNNLAFRYMEAGRYGEARTQCELALEMVPAEGHMASRIRPSALAIENNLVCLDAATGGWERAADRAAALIEQRRSDYAVHRDRNMAYLARALANSAIPFAAVGEAERAGTAIAEARSLHRITAARAPIFAFEAAESALIDAVVRALADSSQSALEALDDAGKTVGGVRAEVGPLAERVAKAIATLAAGLGGGSQLACNELAAIGGDEGSRVRFPVLLEYKDL
ncbi:hypothetical protein SCMU_00330 [Sinomonas cyclohexanicum]|uniref:Tetratricopeptide repeat protein n=1 Tax=Sinomonas cyclohexanicum TaxID=322009 RepID=A0ABN6FDS7_SINCY|nr:tetratricopeptide repeat protein [Corynebacterium cyclohexanicum]BCT74191.1 hypothetical protein SCMU_00330 [Corynebacterium cyclohexanicum]